MTGILSSRSTAAQAKGKAGVHIALRRLLVFGLISALITLAGCGGGGFNRPGGIAALAVTITNVSTVTAGTGESAIRIDFAVAGEPGQTFGLLFQYFIDSNMNGMRDAGEPLLTMTEVSMALESLLGLTSQGDLASFPSGQNMVSATFIWQAGADLGFAATNYGIVVTPSSNDPNQTVQGDSTTNSLLYSAGNAPTTYMGSVGPAGMPGSGRASHTEALVSNLGPTAAVTDLGNEVLVVGGTNGVMDLANIDRFSINGNAGTVTASGTFNDQNVRIQHASASYFGTTTAASTAIRVLVCGGQVAGSPTATAQVYSFGPSGLESVVVTGAMNTARRMHAACWLPDNRIFVHGGLISGGAATNTAEIYDPVSGTFSNLTVPGTVPARAGHSCSLLPNGRVLIAGGGNGGSAVNAFLYDPKSNTWTDTGTSVDRVGHTATMLVNGVCALVGGRTNAGSALSSVTFYRTFGETFNGNPIPSGFTTTAATLASARAEHAASRLADGSVLVTGGFGGSNATLATAEVFYPSKFTDPAIGFFTATNPTPFTTMDLAASRARHTQTTTASGSAAVVGGVTGTTASNTVLDTVEVFQFQNGAPSVSGIGATGGLSDVSVTFTLADVEGDCSFVIFRYSTNGGTNFNFGTLTDYKGTVNLAPGTRTIHWNAAMDGIGSLSGVVVEIIPVGGVVGAPARATL